MLSNENGIFNRLTLPRKLQVFQMSEGEKEKYGVAGDQKSHDENFPPFLLRLVRILSVLLHGGKSQIYITLWSASHPADELRTAEEGNISRPPTRGVTHHFAILLTIESPIFLTHHEDFRPDGLNRRWSWKYYVFPVFTILLCERKRVTAETREWMLQPFSSILPRRAWNGCPLLIPARSCKNICRKMFDNVICGFLLCLQGLRILIEISLWSRCRTAINDISEFTHKWNINLSSYFDMKYCVESAISPCWSNKFCENWIKMSPLALNDPSTATVAFITFDRLHF